MTVTGIVLAGGRGRRFGGPKALVPVGGRSLVERAAAALAPHCDEVVVATRRGVALPRLEARVVEDPDGEPSALGGLHSGLSAAAGGDVLVLACDLLVEPALLGRIAGAAGRAAVAVDEHGPQPLCARYPRAEALVACRQLLDAGDLRARRLPEALGAVPVPAFPKEIRNVNTWPDALAANLGVPALSPAALELILDLTREVAHGTERANGPVASFLAGYAAAQGGQDPEVALQAALEAARGLMPG